MNSYPRTTGRQPAPAAAMLDVINPATGERLGQAPQCDRQVLDAAMAAAAAAAPAWAADEPSRCLAMQAAARALSAAARQVGETITREQGKPLPLAVGEVHVAAAAMRYMASLELTDETVRDDVRAHVTMTRRPFGVVAAIVPWNYPVAIAAGKIAPAIRAGNTVVLKPSPFTPLATLQMAEVLREVLPAGVLNVVTGGDQLGADMISHPTPRMVSFTGSVAAGQQVARQAAAGLKRVICELGGNDAAIVLDDLDPAAVAQRLFGKSLINSGQACMLIKRLYVHQSRYAATVAALAEAARAARIGDGMDPATQYGPVSTRPQFERVGQLVDEALRQGARAASGGAPANGPGYFYPPTILADARHDMAVVREEQFGPVLPVIPYRDEQDALCQANATQFGLGGSVWSTDPERAWDLARRMECGTIWVNTHAEVGSGQPFGGMKSSGIGIENGLPGLHEYTALQVHHRPAFR
jgi:acyl-CoA reductase-like NAD-dependent aldehyde dehydrogenase